MRQDSSSWLPFEQKKSNSENTISPWHIIVLHNMVHSLHVALVHLPSWYILLKTFSLHVRVRVRVRVQVGLLFREIVKTVDANTILNLRLHPP